MKTGNLVPSEVSNILPRNAPSYIYGKQEPDGIAIPVFTGQLNLDLNKVMVWNDLHGSKIDADLLARTESVRRYYGIKHLIIGGDLADNEVMNKHRPFTKRFIANAAPEIKIVGEILDFAADYYDVIYVMPGNHDYWAIVQTEGAFGFSDLIRMAYNSDKVRRKVVPTDYDRLTVKNADRLWTIAHQDAYNQAPLVVAQKLSEQFETDIYTTHQHISAGPVWSKNGKHLLMDVGGLHDPKKFAYAQMRTRIHRTQQQGFAVLVDGKPELWTPDDILTDWKKVS